MAYIKYFQLTLLQNTAAIAAIRHRIILDDVKTQIIKRYPGVSEEALNPNHYGAKSNWGGW
jgi:hypothetical protein